MEPYSLGRVTLLATKRLSLGPIRAWGDCPEANAGLQRVCAVARRSYRGCDAVDNDVACSRQHLGYKILQSKGRIEQQYLACRSTQRTAQRVGRMNFCRGDGLVPHNAGECGGSLASSACGPNMFTDLQTSSGTASVTLQVVLHSPMRPMYRSLQLTTSSWLLVIVWA